MAGIRTYVEEIVNELSNKVSWPTWEELQTSSVIVLVTSIILALIIWLMDYAFEMSFPGPIFMVLILGSNLSRSGSAESPTAITADIAMHLSPAEP